MRYVFYVIFPTPYHPTTVHVQNVEDLSTIQDLIKEWSEDDDRFQFEIVPVKS